MKTLKKMWKQKELYLIVLPVLLYYLLFHYKPMYGLIIAFMDYSPRRGISGSTWVGLQHFMNFFQSIYFKRLLGNTLKISLATIVFGFPAPIILALLMNELRSKKFARVTQTITYMPHFISTVVICSMIREFVKPEGFITQILVKFFDYGGKNLLSQPENFVYLAALTAVDTELYEAAQIDGAGRWKQMLHITLPGIMPTIIIMLIMRLGQVMSVGYEKIILLYNEGIYETADVISTYVYRMGLVDRQYSFSAAVGLFNSVVNFLLVILANRFSKKVSDTSLW